MELTCSRGPQLDLIDQTEKWHPLPVKPFFKGLGLLFRCHYIRTSFTKETKHFLKIVGFIYAGSVYFSRKIGLRVLVIKGQAFIAYMLLYIFFRLSHNS